MTLKSQLENSMLGPQRERGVAFQVGTILNAYYDKSDNRSSQAYVDITMTDASGNVKNSFYKVPMLKLGGISVALPVVGTSGVIGFLNGNMGKPFLIGTLETSLTDSITRDNMTPVQLPSTITS